MWVIYQNSGHRFKQWSRILQNDFVILPITVVSGLTSSPLRLVLNSKTLLCFYNKLSTSSTISPANHFLFSALYIHSQKNTFLPMISFNNAGLFSVPPLRGLLWFPMSDNYGGGDHRPYQEALYIFWIITGSGVTVKTALWRNSG